MFFARKPKYQSPPYFEAGTNWGNAFRTQLTRTVPVFSIVVSAECVRAVGKMKVSRRAHWLSPFLTSPSGSAADNRRC
jgi:hypothetical protein